MKSIDCRAGEHGRCTGQAGRFLPSLTKVSCACVCHQARVLSTREVLELGNRDCEVKPEDEGFIMNRTQPDPPLFPPDPMTFQGEIFKIKK